MRLYNTPDRNIIDLELPKDSPIKIYTCGPTVYDYPHIGNWYTFIRYDLLNRVLLANGYTTEWVMNITDVGHLVSDADEGQDKLEKGAAREGKTAWDVAKTYSEYFISGMSRLNFSRIKHTPKATDYITEQIELVQRLADSGYTYVIDDGVYFDTAKFPEYATFAGLQLDNQEEGARVEFNSQKRNGSDFALWKFSPRGEERDMEWDSPWGKGFPGWHLECSAMIHALLGEPIHIHAGGVDHIPIHHTNEIAQSVAAYSEPLSRYWMHCNHIMVDGKKMAKSAGNIYTLEDVEKEGFTLEDFRLHVLSGHYRSESQFSWENVNATKNRVKNWRRFACLRWQTKNETIHTETNRAIQTAADAFLRAISNDLNSPEAMAVVDDTLSDLSRESLNEGSDKEIENLFAIIDSCFGTKILASTPDLSDQVKTLFQQREDARANKDWQKSDILREELKAHGVGVDDALHSYWYCL